jgi:POT family proton-dependent oligopeptide transporter
MADISMQQPKGLWVLFMSEMWEHFSYYGMRALLVFYLIASTSDELAAGNRGFGWSEESAYLLYGLDTWAVYLTPIFGGLQTGPGALLCFMGGLLLIVVGTGCFKPCVSVMVGQMYGPDDPRRDSGFTI